MSTVTTSTTMAAKPVITSGKELAAFFTTNSIAEHPFFKRPDNHHLGYISVIMENGRELDITGFLARLISIADNIEVRCKLVPQLYDELGCGNSQNIHIKLIGRYLNAVKPYCNVHPDDLQKLEDAYVKLGITYRRLFKESSYYEALGVAVANELVVQPIFEYLKDVTLNSNHPLNPDDLLWITSHNELEEGHVEDSFELAALIPADKQSLTSAMDAAYELYTGIWNFFDTVNEIRLMQV